MLFNSIEFLLFFPTVTFLYFVFPHHCRWLLLLIASCIFYMAFIPYYIFILAFVIIVDYCAGLLIERAQGKRRKLYLMISICTNVGFLAFFKYFNFINFNLVQVAKFLHWNYPVPYLSIILPIGLSFHTFQAMSYTIEIYRGRQKPERHFGIFALYVLFYPQLVAGPIERPAHLIHQFYENHDFDYQRVTDGLKLMAWGFFKKLVIADNFAVFVNQVYGNPTSFEGIPLLIATLFFAFQIYCDFSGYSDIAIGAAQVMGFRLMNNFHAPYSSTSVQEFWKRWHISLSTWFRDYVYIPLGGNRVPKAFWIRNILITFLISGLWHGANWTFIFWGLLHAIYMLTSVLTFQLRNRFVHWLGFNRFPKFHRALKIFLTFTLVSFAWIFFRATTISDAFYIISHLFVNFFKSTAILSSLAGQRKKEILVAMVSVFAMEFVHVMQKRTRIREWLPQQNLFFRWACYYGVVFLIFFFGWHEQPLQFIYFQF